MGIAPTIDLTTGQRRTVLALLRRHLPNTGVWAYGSRVKWTSQPTSDLDLVAFAKPEQSPRIAELREAFDESNLPFRVDLFVWDDVPKDFRRRIEAEHVVLVKEEKRIHSVWPTTTTLGTVVNNLDSRRVPLSRRERELRCGSYPYYGATGVMDYVDDFLFEGPHVLVAEDGSVEQPDGTPFTQFVRGKFWVNNHAHVLTGETEQDTRYLYYAISAVAIRPYISGSVQAKLSQVNLNRIPIPYPDATTRQAILGILGALDDKIELNRRMADTLEETAGALFKSWFVDFDPVLAQKGWSSAKAPPKVARLFPRRLAKSDVGEIPDGWSVRSLGELLEFVYGKGLRSNERQGGSIPVYGSNGQVGWHDRKLVPGPGIVVGRKGNPGVVTWSQGDFFPIDTTFYVVPKGKVSLRFLFYALRNQKLQSIAADSAVPGLNRNIAYMSRQLVPSGGIMDAFDGYADGILSRREQLSAESRALADMRDTLLPKLLSGEIRIQDAEKLAEAAT